MLGAILAVDQGTTNSKAVLIDKAGNTIARGSSPVEISYPHSGWVEQNPDQIWHSILTAVAECLSHAPDTKIIALGISNQRESVVAWDRRSGIPLGPVLTWQCRRTASKCEALKTAGHQADVIARTGLPLDPLFPATKVRWLLDTYCAEMPSEDICVGTIDSWLIWKFSDGKIHATDSSNASRTQIFNIQQGRWDETLADLFKVPIEILPEVRDSSSVFGSTQNVPGLPDDIPIASAIGDSHGALFGHGAFRTGDGKITFGTGSSLMVTIPEFQAPPKGVTTTIAWSLRGKFTYAFEGNILVSASILPWTTKLLGLENVDALLDLAQTVESSENVTLVPAHVGLGSPHWNADARGLICGLSFGSEPAHIARAASESIALQVHDVFDVIVENSTYDVGRLFVDGGPSRNRFLMHLVAGYLEHPLIMNKSSEASARGAAFLAGLAVGFWPSLETITEIEPPSETLTTELPYDLRAQTLKAWQSSIVRSTLKP